MENQKNPEMNRRKFIGAAATALFAGITIQILGCDDEYASNPNSTRNINPDPNYSDANPSNPAAAPNNALTAATADRTGVVGANHPAPGDHIAKVTGAQLDAGGALLLSIMGNALHDHTISLTAQDMTNIKNGVMVAKTSTTTNLHSHTVTFAAVTSIIRGRTTL